MTNRVGVKQVMGSKQTRESKTGKMASVIHMAVRSAPNDRLIWQKCILKASSHVRLDGMTNRVGVKQVMGSEQTRDSIE